MRYLLLLFIFIASSCNNKKEEKVYCQGEVIQETRRNAENGERFDTIYLVCASQCSNGSLCNPIIKEYDPPLEGEVVRRIWCGCEGDEEPHGCDVILEKVQIGDTILENAVCATFDKSCPLPADSCLPVYKNRKDTIRSVISQKDSIYRQRKITTCECMNRVS